MKTEETKTIEKPKQIPKTEEVKVSENITTEKEKLTDPKEFKTEENKTSEIKQESEKKEDEEIKKEEEEKNNDESENKEQEDENINFKFREKLLVNEIPKKYGNRLREDYKYDNEGENGLFESSPKMVKISGFEINKTLMTKVEIINKSKYSERIIILPPQSSNFKIKYKKKGQVAPGLSEKIYIFFTPSEYKYYTDNICINCPGNKIIIPIHAYPKMNMLVNEYIPKLIDFGNVQIDTSISKNISVKNLIDQNFKYKITPLTECKDIKIDKMEDIFYEMKDNLIQITVKPKKYGIIKADFEFQLNEVDFQPYTFTVFATCNNFKPTKTIYPKYLNPIDSKKRKKMYTTKENKKNSEKSETKKTATINKADNKIDFSKIDNLSDTNKSEKKNPNSSTIIKDNLLADQETMNRNIKTAPSIPVITKKDADNKKEENDNNKNNLEDSIGNDITRPESKILNRFKDMPSTKEKQFLQYYNTNDEKIQAKEFKYIRFIGKEPLTEKESNALLNERNNSLQSIIDFNCKMDKNRHKLELDKEKCVIDKNQQFYLKPNFNSNQNDNFFKTRNYFKIFLKGLTKLIIRKRADDRLKKLSEMCLKNNIKNKQHFFDYCDKDWLNFFSKDQQSSNDESNFNFMQMKFIPPKLLYKEKIYLTNEYSLNSLKQNIPHENNIVLDEYDTYKELERNDLEVINYNNFVDPGVTQFDLNIGDKKIRPSCPSENLIREERGDTEFDPTKHETYFEISQKHLEHIYTEPHDLIFINPMLKNYKTLNDNTEYNLDYNLQPRPIKECYVKNSTYQNDIYMKLNLSFTDNDSIRTRTVDNEVIFFDSNINFNFKNMPKIEKIDEKDLFIKKNEKVDEDNFIFELIKDDDKSIVENIEKEDNEIKNVREKNKDGIFDIRKQEKINLENKFCSIKKKWMSLVPTYIEYMNSGIKNPANKLLP